MNHHILKNNLNNLNNFLLELYLEYIRIVNFLIVVGYKFVYCCFHLFTNIIYEKRVNETKFGFVDSLKYINY
jgi:hypothetical protein